MAGSDYGFIVSKNNKIKKDLFEGIGDDNFYINFYKYFCYVYVDGELVQTLCGLEDSHLPYDKCINRIKINNILLTFKRINDIVFLKFKYKNDLYKIIYGYGVGYNVKEWWKEVLELNKKKYNSTLKYIKYLTKQEGYFMRDININKEKT